MTAFKIAMLTAMLAALYNISETVDMSADIYMRGREIETPLKLLVNGRLGSLFYLKYVGNVVWLIVPVIVLYHRRLSRGTAAALCAVAFTLALIGVKGASNYRYALTALPFMLGALLLMGSELLRDAPPSARAAAGGALVALALFHAHRHADSYHYFYRYVHQQRVPAIPFQLLAHVDTIPRTDGILVMEDTPLFFYYCERPFLPYNTSFVAREKGAGLATPGGIENLFDRAQPGDPIARAFARLKDHYKIRYVLSATTLLPYHADMASLLARGGRTVRLESGFRLTRLTDHLLEPEAATRGVKPVASVDLSRLKLEVPVDREGTRLAPGLEVLACAGAHRVSVDSGIVGLETIAGAGPRHPSITVGLPVEPVPENVRWVLRCRARRKGPGTTTAAIRCEVDGALYEQRVVIEPGAGWSDHHVVMEARPGARRLFASIEEQAASGSVLELAELALFVAQ